jgi:hypothetical protein
MKDLRERGECTGTKMKIDVSGKGPKFRSVWAYALRREDGLGKISWLSTKIPDLAGRKTKIRSNILSDEE